MHEPRVATILDTQAWKLNPGDQILLSNGQTSQVRRIRQHETSPNTHMYVDTDAGTAVVHRDKAFRLAPANTRQQMLPGYGTPGGNTNALPWHNHSGTTPGATSSPGAAPTCPNCGHKMVQRGSSFVCTNCGHTLSQSGTSGVNFSSAPRILDPRHSSKKYSTVNEPHLSVVAKVAAAMADKENNR